MNFKTIAASLISTWLLVLVAGAVQADTELSATSNAVDEEQVERFYL
jgi:hypothetical protein